MTAGDALAAYYEEWRSLTEAEGQAIPQAAWDQLDHAQSVKVKLQALIQQSTEKLKREMPAPFAQREAIEDQFKVIVEELIQLEQRNSRLLAAQRHSAEVQKGHL